MRRRPSVEVAEVCTELSASRSTVYRLIRSGELEAWQGSGRTSKYLVYEDSIEAYRARQAVKPAYDRQKIKDLLAA